MFKKITLLLLCFTMCLALNAQSEAETLLDKSIKYHDPKNNWENFSSRLNFTVERAEKPNDKRKVFIDNKKDAFKFWAQYEEGLLMYSVDKNLGHASWNASENVPETISKKYRVSKDRAVMYRDYYTYLYGMPMKLKDAGTIIHPDVDRVEFYGKTLDKIKITYEASVGSDIWYFYFNTTNHALEAYQFFREEEKNDGEYILFEEIKEIQGIKIPRIRKWYYNKGQKYLATDILED